MPDHVAPFDGHHLLSAPALRQPTGREDSVSLFISYFHAQIRMGEEIAIFPIGRDELGIQEKLQPQEGAADGNKNQLRVGDPESAGIVACDIGSEEDRHHLGPKLLCSQEMGFPGRAVNPDIRQQKLEGAEKKEDPVADFIGMHRLGHR